MAHLTLLNMTPLSGHTYRCALEAVTGTSLWAAPWHCYVRSAVHVGQAGTSIRRAEAHGKVMGIKADVSGQFWGVGGQEV